jgi:hypothetical protein
MAHNYAQDQETADALLKEFGQRGAIRRDSIIHLATFAVMGSVQESRDGGLVQVEQMNVLLSILDPDSKQLAIVPDNFDYLVLADGTERRIKSVNPFGPGGVTVYYELIVEGK